MWAKLVQVVLVVSMTISRNSIESKPIGETAKVVEEKLLSSIVNSMIKMLEMKTENQSPKCTEITGPIIEQALENLQDVLPKKIPIIPYALLEPINAGTLLFLSEVGSSIVNITKFSVNSSVNSTGNDTEISVSLRFDPITLAGNYQLDLDSFSLHVFGDGAYNFTFDDLSLSFTTNMLIQENKFQMTDFSFNATVNSSNIQINGLLDGNTGVVPILQVVSLVIPEEVAAATDIFRDLAKGYVINFTNKTLAPQFSWDDIVWLLCTLAGYID